MSFGKLSQEFCAEFKAALALHGQKPTNEVYQQCMAAIEKHKITYKFAAKPALFLVHKENRRG